MRRLGIREDNLEERFIRSSGPGGQKVNKAATCVVLLHRPTGLTVRCQMARSQGFNRFWARRILIEKMERQILGEKSTEQQRIEKIRRQKRKRSRRARERMMADKRHQAGKKGLRATVRADRD